MQLEERLKGKIDEKFKDDVSFESERETFTKSVLIISRLLAA